MEPIKKRYKEETSIYLKAKTKLETKKLVASFFTELILRSGEILFTLFLILIIAKSDFKYFDKSEVVILG